MASQALSPKPTPITLHEEERNHNKQEDVQDQTEKAEGGNDDSDDNGDGDDSDDSDDEDEDDEPEAIARRLGDQLWADIQRARAGATAPSPPIVARRSPKEEAAFATMKTVLAYAASDRLVHSTLSSTIIPGFGGSNALEMLHKIMEDGRVTRQVAGPLSQVLVKLAKSEVLFSPLPALPLQNLKRKHEDKESVSVPAKRPAVGEKEPFTQMEDSTP